jgi:hypothetical protein
MKLLDVPASGSVANETHSRNQYGQYVRPRTAPTQPSSTQAINARQAMADAVARWNALSFARLQSWLGTIQTRRDALGREIQLSGRALFLALNVTSRFYLGTFIDDPPAPPLFDLLQVTFTRTQVLGVVHLVIDWSPAPAGGLLVLYGTGPVNTGVTAFTTWGRALNWLSINLSVATPPLSGAAVDPNWVLRFGPQPGLGGVSFFGWRQLSNGVLGPMVTSRVVTV